jgi:DNA-binding SARP family transcriptional activator
VAEELWSDSHGDVGKQLRQALWILRAGLGHGEACHALIRADAGWISCPETPLVFVDHREFRRIVDLAAHERSSGREIRLLLDRATAIESMGRHTLLDGWSEPWILEARAWVDARRLDALHTIVAVSQEDADHEGVLRSTEEALRLDPSSEYFHRERIRALGELGDRGGAWNAYQDCRDGLRAKGLDPAPETVALVERAVGVSTSGSSGDVERAAKSSRC